MKKLFTISLLSIYLLSSTELNQLIKLPLLIEHFIEHKEKNNNLSLWQFLSMHYNQNDDHDGDRDKDMKLPFKSHDSCINTIETAFIPNSFYHLFIKQVYTDRGTYLIFSETFLSSAHLSSIWQPPKSC